MLIEKVNQSVDFIKSKIPAVPDIAVILGSGLGEFGEGIENPIIIPYSEIPGFVQSTAPSHKGRMIIGKLDNKNILCMQGRFHLYEGYSAKEVTYPIRVMKQLGIEKLIITNAAGGIHPSHKPGDLMIITDHINLMSMNPLIGKNEEEFGTRFQDMTYAYNSEIRNTVKKVADGLGINIKEGIYVGLTGPTFETPAEIKFYQLIGGDAVGMSTIPEVIVANHCGIKVCGISCITNLGSGLSDQPVTEEEVITVAAETSLKFIALLKNTVKEL